jgi:hypothetical protein
MRAVQDCTGGCRINARYSLPGHLLNALERRFSPWRVEYIARALTADELAVIANLDDALIIARIARMSNRLLEQFDDVLPLATECRLYQDLQLHWLRTEEYLLGTRLGRKPTHREFFIDFMQNHNGLRFRAYFVLKFPEKVMHLRRK